MCDLIHYIKVSTSPNGCDSYDAKQFKCDRYLDCESCLEDKIIEHDKHIIEQYKANTDLKNTIREIHDNVSKEMYCKGIDDFVNMVLKEGMIGLVQYAKIKEIAEQLKGSEINE